MPSPSVFFGRTGVKRQFSVVMVLNKRFSEAFNLIAFCSEPLQFRDQATRGWIEPILARIAEERSGLAEACIFLRPNHQDKRHVVVPSIDTLGAEAGWNSTHKIIRDSACRLHIDHEARGAEVCDSKPLDMSQVC